MDVSAENPGAPASRPASTEVGASPRTAVESAGPGSRPPARRGNRHPWHFARQPDSAGIHLSPDRSSPPRRRGPLRMPSPVLLTPAEKQKSRSACLCVQLPA
eukprot:scaffold544_cov256-Pinguiococcus_pyrenoidosus.AAC.6